jgi:hypothetical protein
LRGRSEKLLLKNKIRSLSRSSIETKQATRRAHDAEADAKYAIDFSMMAIDDAEVAVLEAISARVYAESLLQK